MIDLSISLPLSGEIVIFQHDITHSKLHTLWCLASTPAPELSSEVTLTTSPAWLAIINWPSYTTYDMYIHNCMYMYLYFYMW